MSEIIITTEIPREDGYLYFVCKDKKGNVEVRRAMMARGGRKKKSK